MILINGQPVIAERQFFSGLEQHGVKLLLRPKLCIRNIEYTLGLYITKWWNMSRLKMQRHERAFAE